MEIQTKEQLENRLNKLRELFDNRIHMEAVNAINEYLKHNPEGLHGNNAIEKLTDSICLSGAWIFDRVQNKICTTHSKDYRGSMTKKIRKALGYTY